jgi:hypothetical protein
MAIPSIYINLEDDVQEIAARLKRTTAKQMVLVCPKRCFLFSDSENLVVLKKQADLLDKEVFILTMDERGQQYAKEAGFGLKFLPKVPNAKSISDIRPLPKKPQNLKRDERVTERQGSLIEPVMNNAPLPEIVQQEEEPQQPADIPKEPAQAQEPEEQPKEANIESPKVLISEIKMPEPAESKPEVALAASDTIFPPDFEKQMEEEKSKSRSHKILAGFTALCLVLALVLIFIVLPQATVIVFPKTEPVTRDMQISIGTGIKQPDTANLELPATAVSQTVTVSGQFDSQGQKEVGNQAEGTVQIYNFTGVPISLKTQTTTLTAGDNTYDLVANVTGLKPTTYTNAQTKEVNQNSLGASYQIIASQGGDNYNMPAGTRLEITNQVFGSRPLYLYAKTSSEISGGTTRYLSIISQSDVSAAEAQLQSQVISQIRQQLKSQGLAMPDGAYNVSVTSFTTNSPIGAETPVFSADLTAQVSGLAFSETDLKNMVLGRISQTLATNKTLQSPGQNQPEYQIQSWDANNQMAILSVHFEGQEVFNLSLAGIPQQLTGKTESQVNEILQSNEAIDKVEITLAPSWQRNFPLFASKIKVSLSPFQFSN